MQNHWWHRESMAEGVRRLVGKSLTAFLRVGGVTVLLWLLVGAITSGADTVNEQEQQSFEFISDVSTPLGLSRLMGLMTTDGIRCRIAIYWTEPRRVRHSTALLNACDLLFTEDAVHYWMPGMTQPGRLHACDIASESLLPSQNDLPSVVRSALAIACNVRCDRGPEATAWNLQDFLRQSRTRAEYRCEFIPADGDAIDLFGDTVTDAQILNALPLGRKYSKDVSDDGSLSWQLKKALTDRFVIGALVTRVDDTEDGVDACPFDVETLGQWKRVPEPCRAYWRFRSAVSELDAAAHPETEGHDLCERIESYLKTDQAPNHVQRAMEYLWVETVFIARDLDRIEQALRAMTAGLCQDDTLKPYHALLEMAEVSGRMESEYPEQFQAIWEPLVEQMVVQFGDGIVERLDRVIAAIQTNRRYSYGEILFETIRRQSWARSTTVEKLLAKYEATRLSVRTEPFDLSTACAGVKRYLAQQEIGPPRGTLSMQDVRGVLERGLTLPEKDGDTDAKVALVGGVLELLHSIVGDGPFCGDPAKLTDSVRQFSQTYFVVCRNTEPIAPVLATFLALSFCDTSTADDHGRLCEQVREIGTQLETRLNASIADWNFSSLVTPEDTERIVQKYCVDQFRRYVDDPLCPTFKFPLTANETTRLVNQVSLGLGRLEPVYEEMSLKVKYGGVSEQLKEEALRPIANAVQGLLPAAAFLRRPAYPGIVYQYRGRHGFSAVIPGPFYEETDRPKDRFQAMKYFHLGHRLDDVVRAERDLAKLPGQADDGQDGPREREEP